MTPDAAADDDLGLEDAIVQLSFAVQGILGAVAARHDLSLTQMRLLGILRDRKPGILWLARALGLEKSSVTGLVDRAESRGLLSRRADPADGRAVAVALTPKGRRLAARVAAEVGTGIETLVASLSTTNRTQLSRLATRLVREHAEREGVDLS